MRRLLLLATQLACGTLGGEGGGAANLPNRGVVPYEPAGIVADGRDPSALVRGGQVHLYYSTSSTALARVVGDGASFGAPEEVSGLLGAAAVVEHEGRLHAVDDGGDCRAIRYGTGDGLRFEMRAVLWPREPDEADGLCRPSLLARDGGFELYYEARARGRSVIVHASAGPDLVFARRGPILDPSTGCIGANGRSAPCFDEDGVESPEVRAATSATGRPLVRLWFNGRARGATELAFAASEDGAQFSRYPDNPLIEGAAAPSNVRLGDTYWLYYRGAEGIVAAKNARGRPSESF